MKKLLAIGGTLGILVIVAFVLVQGPSNVKASQSSTQVNTNETANNTATSTATHITSSSATSTLAFDPENSNVIHVFLASYSTSTPPDVNVGVEFSNNDSDWYPMQVPTAGNPTALILGTAGNLYTWNAATSSANETVTTSFPIVANNFAAKYARLTYKIVSGGSSDLHVEVGQKKEF